MSSNFRQINMTEPHAWYPKARLMKPRKVVVHIGPTNSGKTFTALKSLEDANSGIYLGPLRLLAWEVFEKLGTGGVRCGLLTGQEREFPDDHTHVSCTIEMADLNRVYDVAVIDEGQLIGDQQRGWAWTSAFLGLCAHEVHVCGSKTLLPVIEKLCKKTGDDLTITHYERLSPLSVMNLALGNYKGIQKGDCIVGFSRKELYRMKYTIERKCQDNGIRCCVIYGNLPPEARQAQARLFNDESSEYDVLVASDAIGMGLNLSIKRIIFSTLEKYDGFEFRRLRSQEIKQIAGRAGRYGTAFEDGLVTCLKSHEVHYLKSAMNEGDQDVITAGLFPTQEQLRLLGIMMDYNVGNDALSRFQIYEEELEWGMQSSKNDTSRNARKQYGNSKDIWQYGIDAEMIGSKFGGFSNFIRKFEAYLAEEEGIEYVNRIRRVNKKKKSRHKRRSFRYVDEENDDDFDDEEESGADGYCRSDIDGDYYHDDFDSDNLNYNDPLCGLANLYKKFKSAADLDNNNTYFLCNMKERIKLAEVLDPLPLTFHEKFTFCMAPVDIGNTIILRTFARFADDFANTNEVLINKTQARKIIEMSAKSKKLQDVKFIVSTPEELIRFEVYHKIYDLYRWLGLRFADQFTDIELAVECATCTGYIVGEAVRILGPEFLDNKKNKEKKERKQKKGKNGKDKKDGKMSVDDYNYYDDDRSGYDDVIDSDEEDEENEFDVDDFVYEDAYSYNRAKKSASASDSVGGNNKGGNKGRKIKARKGKKSKKKVLDYMQ